jgi:ubiquinone/menaquinone biosynthesis C-methylase UbiE
MSDTDRPPLHRAVTAYDRVANAYEVGRPGYPPEAVAWIAESAAVGPASRIVDLAAGTGKLTRLLLAIGAEVIAVEPVAVFRQSLSELPIDARDGVAEALPLADASVDLLTVGAAFHWFDARRGNQ